MNCRASMREGEIERGKEKQFYVRYENMESNFCIIHALHRRGKGKEGSSIR